MSKVLVFIFSLTLPFHFIGQDDFQRIQDYEVKLSKELSELRKLRKDEPIKEKNESFKKLLEEVLELEEAFDYPFSSLTTIGKIYSEDKEIRIISWNVEWEDHQNSYFSYILKKENRRSGHFVVPLKDNSIMLPYQPKDQLDADNWYGALYYDIKDVEKGRRTYYTLFGYDANDDRSTIKLLDVLYFVGKKPKFGYPLFETEDGYANRVYFEHANKAVMSLKYDKKRDMIIFDHLSPESPGLAEFREYYIPDMSYDAYVFEKNKWRLREDVIAINKDDKKEIVELKRYDPKTDSVVSVPMKNKWEDPTDSNAPIDSGGHRAVLPDDERFDDKKTNKDKKIKAPEEKEFSGVSFSNLPSQKKSKKRKKKKRN